MAERGRERPHPQAPFWGADKPLSCAAPWRRPGSAALAAIDGWDCIRSHGELIRLVGPYEGRYGSCRRPRVASAPRCINAALHCRQCRRRCHRGPLSELSLANALYSTVVLGERAASLRPPPPAGGGVGDEQVLPQRRQERHPRLGGEATPAAGGRAGCATRWPSTSIAPPSPLPSGRTVCRQAAAAMATGGGSHAQASGRAPPNTTI